jgi:hypothetical protein
MKKIAFIAVCALFFSGCNSEMASSLVDDFGVKKHWCKNPRPKFCTMIYNPVCGKPINKTYSNGCVACQDKNVKYFIKGACN